MREKSGRVVECTFSDDEPEPEMICEEVTASEKMSVICATSVIPGVVVCAQYSPSSTVCDVRYCFDCNIVKSRNYFRGCCYHDEQLIIA